MSDDTNTTETMTEKLQAAGEKAEKQKAERQARVVKGSHLLQGMLDAATAAGCTAEDMSGFTKLTLASKEKRVLIAKKGGRVDLSGFTVDAPAIRQITEADARAKHLGKVRGQIDFEKSDDEVMSAFNAALAELAIAPPVPEKRAVKKNPDTETPAEQPAEASVEPVLEPTEAVV